MDPSSSRDNAMDAEEEEEIELTPAEVIERLERAWMNEKLAPELLPNLAEIVDCVLDQLKAMKENLTHSKRKNSLRNQIHERELDRIQFVVSDYLRKRLEKIQEFTQHCLDEDAKRVEGGLEPKLTSEEHSFAVQYQKSLEKHLFKVVLSKLPPNARSFNYQAEGAKPDLSRYVFVRVSQPCDPVSVADPSDDSREEITDLELGSQHLLPYKAIQAHLDAGHVVLI